MPLATPTELNPPGGIWQGWGLKEDPVNHTLYKERMAAEQNEDEGVFTFFGDAKSTALQKQSDPQVQSMIKLVQEKMPYDSGWDCDYLDRLLYGHVAVVNQGSVGSCVGAGAASAVASKIATEILIEGDAEKPFDLFVDPQGRNVSQANHAIPFVGYHYGAGKTREKWNGSRFNGTGWCSDGSYCSVQVWALKTTGVLPCSKVKTSSGPYPQSSDVRSWGCNRRGELNDHLDIGQQYLMQETVRVRDADTLWEVLTVLKQPCMICSSWAFQPREQVDGLGWVYTRRGQWMHNMTISAGVDVGGKRYVKVRNQWGPTHRDGWSFWIPLELADRWMRDAECQSIGEITLPKVDLDNLDLGV